MITLNREFLRNMKKYFLIVMAGLALTSCEEEITTNTPAFEATNGYTFWRATKMQAIVNVDNGDLVLVGADESENITLYVGDYDYGAEYPLGETNEHVATYTRDANDTLYFYSTSSSTGNGYIKIDPLEKQKPGTLSGTFYAVMDPVTGSPVIPGQTSVNFNKGIFYQIPIVTAGGPDEEIPEEEESED